jgi:uncharacterized Zn finger protein
MPARTTLADLVSESSLESLAGERYFERGLAYFQDGAVDLLHADEREIAGNILGTESYGVRLWLKRGLLNWACTCPLGEQGEFCKHLVATGLTWLAEQSRNPGSYESPELRSIRAYLAQSDQHTLAQILLARAMREDGLMAELLLAAQRAGVPGSDAARERIRKAFDVRGFVDYGAMRSVVARVAPVSELLRGVLKSDARAAFELSTDAIKRGLKLLEHCDDSDGGLGGILGEIIDTHRQAAADAGMPAAELAGNLFGLQLADGFGFVALEDYEPALGKVGLAAYRKLAEAAWKKIPPRQPGAHDSGNDGRRYQLAGIMTTLARMDNDTDALVGAMQRDLTQPHTYLEIAETLSKAKRHDESLKWAEAGRDAFKGQLNIPLDNFLVTEYHRRKRHDDAVTLRWSRFESHPGLDGYQKLKAAADRAKNWKQWREKALALLRQPNSHKPRTRDVFSYVDSKASVLIQILLWEGNPHAALEVARTSGCPGHLWLQIARALEEQSPADAIGIYQTQIEPIVRMTNNNAYDEAADIVRRIRDLKTGTGKGADFAPYLETLRTQHKAKRNFMQRLEAVATEPAKKGISRKRVH